jgi:hypothetical protein
MYKFLDWIDIDKIDWRQLSSNISDKSIYILEKNINKIHWLSFSQNINAQECIEKIYFFYSLRRVVVNRKVETFLYTPQQFLY